jgi:hypothetical protein
MDNQTQIKPRFVTAADALYSPCIWGINLPRPKKPDNAVRKMICMGKFPFPVRKINGRNMVKVEDIDAWSPPAPEPTARPAAWEHGAPNRRRGRPRLKPGDGSER